MLLRLGRLSMWRRELAPLRLAPCRLELAVAPRSAPSTLPLSAAQYSRSPNARFGFGASPADDVVRARAARRLSCHEGPRPVPRGAAQ